MQYAGQAHKRKSKTIRQSEKVCAPLIAGGISRDAEAFTVAKEGLPLQCSAHSSEEAVVHEVHERQDRLRHVGDENIRCQTFHSRFTSVEVQGSYCRGFTYPKIPDRLPIPAVLGHNVDQAESEKASNNEKD